MPDPAGGRSPAITLTSSALSRVFSIALVFAGLYAAILGAGAFAQDAPDAGTAPATAPPATALAIAAPPAPPPAAAVAASPEAVPAAPDLAPAATPEPAPPAAAAPAPTAPPAPPAPPAVAPTPTPGPAATPPHAAGTPASTVIGVTKERAWRSRPARPNRAQGVAGRCGHGRLIGTVGRSTSASGCTPVDKETPPRPERRRDRITGAPGPGAAGAGAPAAAMPGYSLALPGPAPIGVPNFFIERFRIPPFLLPIYQAAGIQYGVRWEVLAAINEIETDYGRNLNVSSAGALGWMQFMPATWDAYGVDANGDGQKDPFNPVDAIFAAARYLRAAGAEQDLDRAVFAYNHAEWYVDSVLLRARIIGGLPADLVGSLTGLTQGRFPVQARATYRGALTRAERRRRAEPGQNAARVVEADGARRAIRVYSRAGAPVVAVNDGRVTRMGRSPRLGRFVELQDAYGNAYLYAGLGELARTFPFPEQRKARRRAVAPPERDAAPRRAASATSRADLVAGRPDGSRTVPADTPRRRAAARRNAVEAPRPAKERLFAHPSRPQSEDAGGVEQLGRLGPEPRPAPGDPGAADPLVLDGRQLDPDDFTARPLERGARVIGGTVLGRLGGREQQRGAPHLRFEIRPAGRGAPRIDPKPILDGWKLLESTAVYRSQQRNPFFGADAERPSIGQILLMSKEALQRHVLRNPQIDIYPCGRRDVRAGVIDRRVLASLEYLAASGLKPTVSSMSCGHGYYTASGNVSEHSSGSAVDIAAVNGIAITPATQGEGSITDTTIQRLLTLQGAMKPHQIISLMTFDGTDNTYAMGDHDDHIHLGFRPAFGANAKAGRRLAAVLEPEQWVKLIDRIDAIDNPVVHEQPSRFSVAVTKPPRDGR